jgi:signal transduction histidine kinase
MKKLALEGLIPFEHFDKIFYFVIILFVAIQLLAHLLISIFLIFYSHRIAGPLIKIKNTLNGVLKGQDIKEIKFRKNDYFAEFTGPINQFINILTEQNELVKLTEKEINLLKKSYKNDMPIENLSLILERLAKIKIIKE